MNQELFIAETPSALWSNLYERELISHADYNLLKELIVTGQSYFDVLSAKKAKLIQKEFSLNYNKFCLKNGFGSRFSF